MKIKTFELNENTYLPNPLLNIFNSGDYCIIDIETMGLSRQYHEVVLIGVLFNKNNFDSMLWEELNDITFKALKQSVMNPPALGNLNYQIFFFLYVYEK